MQDGFRSMAVPGLGAQEATRTILGILEGRSGLAVHLVAPGRISASRSHRPGWAIVACVATIWIAGLGLLFLLVRRTDAGEITVTDGPRGCMVTLPPFLDAATRGALGEALVTGDPSVPAPPAPAGPGDLDERTVARSEVLPLPPPPAPAPPAPAVELRFPNGTVRVEAGTPVVLGRDPSPTAGAAVQIVPGDASTVSKSHIRAAFDGAVLTVEDLGSTNGSRVRPDGSGDAIELVPGAPLAVAAGGVVELGALACSVATAGAAAAAGTQARPDVEARGA